MKRFCFFMLILLLVTSCTSTYRVSMYPEISKSLIGRSHHSIVSAMGAPYRQTSDGAGGTILIYEDTTMHSIATAYNVNYYTGTYTPGVRTTSHTDYVYVYIHSQGKCYNVKTNLTKEVSEPNPVGTIMSIVGSVLYVVLLCGLC